MSESNLPLNFRYYYRTLYFLILYLFMMWTLFSCSGQSDTGANQNPEYERLRKRMVETQLLPRGIADKKVIAAMTKIPRHLFIPAEYRGNAYDDGPQSIGYNQTISQPYIVAIMTELLHIDSGSNVLEIGTGSGYQAAVLGEIAKAVYSIEIIPELSHKAALLLDSLKYKNIHVKAGDGYLGWPEEAPFDAIIVTAAAPKIPQPLIDQLKVGGKMVIPVGEYNQELYLLTKNEDGVVKKAVIPVRFVPMTGEVQKK
jgi:protein-L-isoaspartate(D-aspartate) O-methyltransferase